MKGKKNVKETNLNVTFLQTVNRSYYIYVRASAKI